MIYSRSKTKEECCGSMISYLKSGSIQAVEQLSSTTSGISHETNVAELNFSICGFLIVIVMELVSTLILTSILLSKL